MNSVLMCYISRKLIWSGPLSATETAMLNEIHDCFTEQVTIPLFGFVVIENLGQHVYIRSASHYYSQN